MINNISTNQMQNSLGKPQFQQQEPVKPQPVDTAEVSIQVGFESLIDKALDVSAADSDAVQKARELLVSGQLEKPENIRTAAENILIFGI
jgi:hypothetical protein